MNIKNVDNDECRSCQRQKQTHITRKEFRIDILDHTKDRLGSRRKASTAYVRWI